MAVLSRRACLVVVAATVLLSHSISTCNAACDVDFIDTCNTTSTICCSSSTQACQNEICVTSCTAPLIADDHFYNGKQCVGLNDCGNGIDNCLDCSGTTCSRCKLGFALQLGGLTCIDLAQTSCEFGTNATLSLSPQTPVYSAICDPPATRQTRSPVASTTLSPIGTPTPAPQASPTDPVTADESIGGLGLSLLAIVVMGVVGGLTVLLCIGVLIYVITTKCSCCQKALPPTYSSGNPQYKTASTDIEMNRLATKPAAKQPKILDFQHSGGDTSDFSSATSHKDSGLKGIEAEEFFKWLAALKKHKATFSILLKEMTTRRDSQTTVTDRQRYTKVVTDLSRLLQLFKQKRSEMVAPTDGMVLLDWAEKTVNKFKQQA